MDARVKYPRTPHMPGSPGATPDDVFTDFDGWYDREIVLTEKMDGENTTLYRDGLHARSIDSKHHVSRDWIKAMHAEKVAGQIPKGMRICGENLYAQHSIKYDSLLSYFAVFSIWEGDTCLSWDDTVTWCELLDLHTVPALYAGKAWSVDFLYKMWYYSVLPRVSEGFVARTEAGFTRDKFSANLAKWVRPHHVQTDTQWMHAAVVPNELRKDES